MTTTTKARQERVTVEITVVCHRDGGFIVTNSGNPGLWTESRHYTSKLSALAAVNATMDSLR